MKGEGFRNHMPPLPFCAIFVITTRRRQKESWEDHPIQFRDVCGFIIEPAPLFLRRLVNEPCSFNNIFNFSQRATIMAIITKHGIDGKVCSTCKKWKALDDFPRDRTHGASQGGRHCRCKACHKAKRQTRHLDRAGAL